MLSGSLASGASLTTASLGKAPLSQPYHLWAPPGHSALEQLDPLVVSFDVSCLDLVSPLPDKISHVIADFELQHLCDLRPHEDPRVEAWLCRWADGEGGDGPIVLTASSAPALAELAAERPEVCPLLRKELTRFDAAVAAWLTSWPANDPWRKGLPRNSSRWGGITPEEIEVELHSVLSLCRAALDAAAMTAVTGGVVVPSLSPAPVPPTWCQAAEHFKEVAVGWIFKLESIYGLPLVDQPERMAVAESRGLAHDAFHGFQALSLLRWDASEMTELLRCPFFRPREDSLYNVLQRWASEGSGAAMGAEALDAMSQALVTELLPEADLHSALRAPATNTDSPAGQDELLTAITAGAGMLEPGLGLSAYDAAMPSEGSATAASSTHRSTDLLPADLSVLKDETPRAVAHLAPEKDLREAPVRHVRGASFERVGRSLDATLQHFDNVDGLGMEQYASGSLHCWNAAEEPQVLGQARHMISSREAMSSRGGRFRFDFRVTSGVEAETAHLLEVGLASKPGAGVTFKVSGPGPLRPTTPGASPEEVNPFFSIVSILDSVVEGVRVSVEADFDSREVRLRNVPPVPGMQDPAPIPLAAWLDARRGHVAAKARPAGELDDELFQKQAEFLHDLIDRGTLDGDLAGTVLGDEGAKCLRGAGAPQDPEAYHFFMVVPAGMEVEIL